MRDGGWLVRDDALEGREVRGESGKWGRIRGRERRSESELLTQIS